MTDVDARPGGRDQQWRQLVGFYEHIMVADPAELLLGESQEEAEERLAAAWDAFCSPGAADSLFPSAITRMLAKRAADRVETAKRWDRNLRLHGAAPLKRYFEY